MSMKSNQNLYLPDKELIINSDSEISIHYSSQWWNDEDIDTTYIMIIAQESLIIIVSKKKESFICNSDRCNSNSSVSHHSSRSVKYT